MTRKCCLIFGLFIASGCRAPTPSPPSAPPVMVSTGTIGLDGSLSQSLALAHIPSFESAQVERTLKPLFNPQRSHPADRYEIICSTSNHFIMLKYWPTSFNFYTVLRSTSGAFSVSAGKIESKQTMVGASGQIQDSLWGAMSKQGVPPDIIIRFAELFSWRLDFLTEPRKGDTYKLVWKRSLGNGAVRDDDIVCASYTSQEKGLLNAIFLAGDYFDSEGNSLRGEFLRAPLVYRRISSYFTERRFHPILRIYRPHHGIDYAAPYGTPASSIADGVVIAKGWEGGLGNELRVRHAGSYTSIYGHLRGYPKGIHIGSHVRQGQVIGFVGSTGLSTGPHLHFGFERDGKLINFFSLKMKNSRKAVPPPERAHFEFLKKQAENFFAQLSSPGAAVQTLNNSL